MRITESKCKECEECDSWGTQSKIWMMGHVIAVTISWSVNKSVLWAFVHGILSWFYVGYYFATKD